MQSGISLFKSKVAKRIFFLFLLCAMIPIAVFSLLAYTQVSSHLKAQSAARLQNAAKSYGLMILERFSFLKSDIDTIRTTDLHQGLERGEWKPGIPEKERMRRHFKAIALVTDQNKIFNFIGNINNLPHSLMEGEANAAASKTTIRFDAQNEGPARVFLTIPMSGPDGRPGLLVGEANTVYLWGIGKDNLLPPFTDTYILDSARHTLLSAFHLPEQILRRIRFESIGMETRSLAYTEGGQRFFIGYWPLFLESKFKGPNIIVLLRNSQKEVFAPISQFNLLFPLVTLLAFWIVLLLSTISIRKSMGPLEKLKEGALRLARRDFDTRVMITSGDEFEALADTFNKSAADLGRQFQAIEAMAEIDRAILSSLDIGQIVDTALKRMSVFFSCDAASFGLIRIRKENMLHAFTHRTEGSGEVIETFLPITAEDRKTLLGTSGHYILDTTADTPSFLPRDSLQGVTSFLVLPLYLNGGLAGVISLGHHQTHAYSDDDLAHAKRLSNQVSVALSHACLVEELELLNWGTLEALARTVDAKSKWTAGHSERVTQLAVKIARVMGCDARTVNALHRAAFLHDIGKIGIPLHILDKPGKLTDEEYELIKKHPEIGARILEPIDAYADVIPIILQHHERFDGKGYPHGDSGDALTLGARILAVADVYDALISKRPYRQGWVQEEVIRWITDESGKHFDPKVVDAFLSALTWTNGGNGDGKWIDRI
jgi:putative nucleotidyltransferase with HDIG domain